MSHRSQVQIFKDAVYYPLISFKRTRRSTHLEEYLVQKKGVKKKIKGHRQHNVDIKNEGSRHSQSSGYIYLVV